jgi:peroxiredoxin family protein
MRALIFLLGLFAATTAQATIFIASGTIEKIITVQQPQNTEESFLLTGFSSAGTCPTNDGLVSIVLGSGDDGRKQLAILLAAKAAGMSITVRVDSTFTTSSGVCRLWVMNIDG